MRTTTGTQQYSFGTLEVSVRYEGQYGQLDEKYSDRMAAASFSNLSQLPQWLETIQTDDQSERITGRDTISSEIKNGHGTIQLTLSFTDTKGVITRQIAQALANSIIASVQAQADAAISGVPVTTDSYVLGFQELQMAAQSSQYSSDRQLVGSSTGGSSRPTQSGSTPRR